MTGVLGGVIGSLAGFAVRYLVIAGGGGSGGGTSGGGGAGGYRSSVPGELSGGGASAESPFVPTLGTSFTVTVGAGGTAGTYDGAQGGNGFNSVLSSITSIGGGGGQHNGPGFSGGSGGGAGYIFAAQNGAGGAGTIGQGYKGGDTTITTSSVGTAAGGGGAGAAGGNVTNINIGGVGGIGVQSAISGTLTYRAGGGAGGNNSGTIDGGLGGGGSSINDQTGTPGTVNTGGGAGGPGTNSARFGGSGGSGIVILRYPASGNLTVGSGLTGSTTTVGDDKVVTFTAGTGAVTFNSTPNTLASALDASSYTGLIGQFFSGDWRSTISTGNIGTLPLSAPTTYSSISYGSRGDYYGLLAIGYFKPPTTGTYTFFTSSDDGSGVWVGALASSAGGRTTANAVLNNNLGGGQGDTKRSGTVSLTANTWYAIRIVHEEGGGGDNLTFSWSGPGIAETTSLSTYFKRPVNLESIPINTFYELTI